MKNQTKKSGFTLAELLIYMGIFSIILVILTEMLFSIFQAKLDSEATSSVEQDSRFIVQRLIYDVHRAQSASVTNSNHTLTLKINNINYIYTTTGQDFTVNTDKLNSFDTSISNLNFQHLGNSINIGGTLISKVTKSSGPEIRNISTTINLRPNN